MSINYNAVFHVLLRAAINATLYRLIDGKIIRVAKLTWSGSPGEEDWSAQLDIVITDPNVEGYTNESVDMAQLHAGLVRNCRAYSDQYWSEWLVSRDNQLDLFEIR